MPTLYHSSGSRGLRALWTIEEMEIDCDLEILPFPPRFRAKPFLDINPLGTMPAYVDGDLTMTESSAIAQYLSIRYGPTDLAIAPEEPDYGAYLDFLHHADATLTFPQTVFIRFTMLEKERGLQEAGEAYADWFRARLGKIDERLSDRDYLCGGRFTIADIAVGYALLVSTKVGLSHHLSLVLEAYLQRLTERPGFLRAIEREQVGAG